LLEMFGASVLSVTELAGFSASLERWADWLEWCAICSCSY